LTDHDYFRTEENHGEGKGEEKERRWEGRKKGIIKLRKSVREGRKKGKEN
jgi:hypothetical protein